MHFKKVRIFDLDQTVLDSSHRYRTLPNGDIDLEYWREMSIPELILQDKALPIAKLMRVSFLYRHCFVAICTSRIMSRADWQLLDNHGLRYHYAMYREHEAITAGCSDHKKHRLIDLAKKLGLTPKQYDRIEIYDDHPGVLSMAESLGMTAIDAVKLNARLFNAA